MPKEVADALKEAGLWNQRARRGGQNAMIAEIGHYALVLALGMALVQAFLPLVGAWKRDPALIGVAEPAACAQFLFVTLAFAALMHGLCRVRLLDPQRRRELALHQTADLQDQRHVGQSRGLAASSGCGSSPCSAERWPCSAATCRPCSGPAC